MKSMLAPGLTLRPAQTSDASAITALMTMADEAEGQDPWVTELDIVEDLNDPELNLETDTWVIEDAGAVVGYGELWNSREEAADAMEMQAWTAPTHRGRGIGSTILDLSEAAATDAARLFTKRPVLLRNFIWADNEAARALLEARGYELVRHFFHMAIDLATAGDPPAPPAGVTIRALDPEHDARPLYDLIQHAFSQHWNWTPITFEAFWRRVGEREDFDPELSLIAMRGEAYVGASWNVTKVDRGWVQDLAVHESARRMGLGESLLRHTFKIFKDRGWKKVGLGLDADNATGALRLYQRVGMNVTRRFDAYEKDVSKDG